MLRRPRTPTLPAALLILGALLGARSLRADAELLDRAYISPADGTRRVYQVRTPSGYDGTSRLPAVLFLHGRGGSMASFQSAGYAAEADARGAVLIFWQGRYDLSIGAFSTQYVDGVNGIPDETDVLACLADSLASFRIDPDRVHLVGFSQGGKGALLIGLKNPDLFASVCEGAGPSDAFEGQIWSPASRFSRAAEGTTSRDRARRSRPLVHRSPRASTSGTRGTCRSTSRTVRGRIRRPRLGGALPLPQHAPHRGHARFADARGSVPRSPNFTSAIRRLRLPDVLPAGSRPRRQGGFSTPGRSSTSCSGEDADAPPAASSRRRTTRWNGAYYWARLGGPRRRTERLRAWTRPPTLPATRSRCGSPGVRAPTSTSSMPGSIPAAADAARGRWPREPLASRARFRRSSACFETASSRRGNGIRRAAPTSSCRLPRASGRGAEDRSRSVGRFSTAISLVPALVDAAGLGGAQFRTELTLTNLSPLPLAIRRCCWMEAARRRRSCCPRSRPGVPVGYSFRARRATGRAAPLRFGSWAERRACSSARRASSARSRTAGPTACRFPSAPCASPSSTPANGSISSARLRRVLLASTSLFSLPSRTCPRRLRCSIPRASS